ncbi:hypothetical protein BCR33DRAFT_518456 [Rhizoclosmatium globosum]|uniref:Man1/Src1-like C-terminal domain-containing protein n=1 Tax=Rhizoclosmatium globosum TaxID=329046 RepID=A0A1Y2BFF2_9FUNG|nr:hypothetical protein BCR33DRAFT_518456 [Rhizoclosmatium globosum]|eukprot:ORY33544.1 hypothetical protein BCR33DRAFT_518456 [Rhizoclosmatium globosum]
MKSVPTKNNLVLWFLLWEGACLTTAMSLFVIHEAWILDYNPLSSVLSFLARSAVIGPGASLMVFAVWREERILNRLIRIVEKASIELEERALLDSFHSAAEFSTSPSSPLQAARVEISAQKQSSSLRKRKSKAKAVSFQQQSDPKSQSRYQTPNPATDVLVTTNTATSLNPTSTVSTTEIEILFARPSYIERLRRITVYLILTAFLLSLSMWYLEVGYNIQYCDASSTMNSHLFPTCVPCPNQAICNQDQVIGCKIDGYSVFGDEGFGPLGSYISLGPVCLPDSDEMVQPHLNPRIKGRTLSLRRRFEVVVMDGWLNYVWFWIVRTSVEVYHLVL